MNIKKIVLTLVVFIIVLGPAGVKGDKNPDWLDAKGLPMIACEGTVASQCTNYCKLLLTTCEKTIMKTNDPMRLCNHDQQKIFGESFEQAREECKQAHPEFVATVRDVITFIKNECRQDRNRIPSECNSFCNAVEGWACGLALVGDFIDQIRYRCPLDRLNQMLDRFKPCSEKIGNLSKQSLPVVKEKETPQAVLERKIKDLVGKGKLAFKESLSLQDLTVLVAVAKELEKEGINVGLGVQASVKHKDKEEL